MRESSFNINDFKGLRPNNRIPRNKPEYLEDCYNVRVGEYGLEPFSALTSPFSGLPTIAHPSPMLFDTKDGLFMASATIIYKVNADYSLTQLLTGLSGTANWHIADFGIYQVWTNGSFLVIRDRDQVFSIQLMPYRVNTVGNYNGQLIAGGFDDNNVTAWSEIGSIGDITKLLEPAVSRKNTAGFMPMDWFGTVYVVKQLGKAVVVYGDSGIAALVPAGQTFGKVNITQFGICSRGAVGGDDKQHVFVDVTGKVWMIEEGLKLKRLDYQEYVSLMTAANIVIPFDNNKRDFYISDGTTCYMLTQQGLSKVFHYPTSVASIGNSLLGVRSVGADVTGYIRTTPFDIGLRSIKTVSGVEFGGEGTGLTAAIDYRFTASASFTSGVAKTVNGAGFVAPIVSGTDFKIKIMSTSYTTFKVDNITVRWKLVDKRGIRGMYDVENRNSKTFA